MGTLRRSGVMEAGEGREVRAWQRCILTYRLASASSYGKLWSMNYRTELFSTWSIDVMPVSVSSKLQADSLLQEISSEKGTAGAFGSQYSTARRLIYLLDEGYWWGTNIIHYKSFTIWNTYLFVFFKSSNRRTSWFHRGMNMEFWAISGWLIPKLCHPSLCNSIKVAELSFLNYKMVMSVKYIFKISWKVSRTS